MNEHTACTAMNISMDQSVVERVAMPNPDRQDAYKIVTEVIASLFL
jgi:hypothetical protein